MLMNRVRIWRPRPEERCPDCLFDLGSLHPQHGSHGSFAQSTSVTTGSHLIAKFAACGKTVERFLYSTARSR